VDDQVVWWPVGTQLKPKPKPSVTFDRTGKVDGGSLSVDPEAIGADLILIRVTRAPFQYSRDLLTAEVTIEVTQ
jgi:hypothetical protein